jgi:hypothetical protein
MLELSLDKFHPYHLSVFANRILVKRCLQAAAKVFVLVRGGRCTPQARLQTVGKNRRRMRYKKTRKSGIGEMSTKTQ